MAMIFTDTVVVVRAGTKTNASGSQVPDWTTATETTYGNVNVQPSTGLSAAIETIGEGEDQTITGWELFTRPGADIDLLATDRLRYSGMTLTVQGEVRRWMDPLKAGAVHHVEATLSRVKG